MPRKAKVRKPTVIRLDRADAAIVFHKNGEIRAYIQDGPPEEIVPDNTLNAMRAVLMFDTPEALALINERMEKLRRGH